MVPLTPGDLNGDDKLDALDIQPVWHRFLTGDGHNELHRLEACATPDPAAVYLADFDNSGMVDLADIEPFVIALLTANP